MKNNNIENIEKKIRECTSCQLCSAVCPTSAINIELNEEGFYIPRVNKERCIDCGKCISVCYKYDENIKMSDENINVYGAKAKEKEILKDSTSGGVATLLLEEGIKNGYKVIGVKYNYEKDIAEAVIIERKEELGIIRGSKYIQSFSEEIFNKVISNLKKDEKYILIGLPCHIYSFNRYLTKIGKKENFILIDLFCHGCPSLNLWKKYIKNLKVEYKIDKFEKIEFRSKRRGWHEFCLYLKSKNREILTKNDLDFFYRLFFSDKILNKSCYNCKLRSTLAYTDIRLGDFWGKKYQLDREGISCIVNVTERGNKYFERIKSNVEIKESTLKEVIKAQSYRKEYRLDKILREKLLKELGREEKNLNKIIMILNKNLSIREELKLIFRKILYFFPQNIKLLLKKII